MKTKNIAKMALCAALTCAPLSTVCASEAPQEDAPSRGFVQTLKDKWQIVILILLIIALGVGLFYYFKREKGNGGK
ncbi:MAG: hypothetical protein AAF335_01460 [Bacteroidota bacterium]